MRHYRLTIAVEFDAIDDVAARDIADHPAVMRDAHVDLRCRMGWPEDGWSHLVKLQRLNPNSPPRLLAKWPNNESESGGTP
jgi:hypothetical protein